MRPLIKFVIVVMAVTILSCKKDKIPDPEPEPPIPTGKISINFENVVDTIPLAFGDKYVNANGDTFQVSKFNYFISNIVLTNSDNSTFAEPNSYHVVRQSVAGSNFITLANVPFASYKSISFMLGVDSARNVSGAQSGELDPGRSGDMYWDWNTGYIFLKFEGTSPQSGSSAKSLTFHIGGYGGPNKTQRSFNFGFNGATANVVSDKTPQVHLSVDVNELFESPNAIKFATQFSQQAAGAGAKVYADNYADMIDFEHVHNY